MAFRRLVYKTQVFVNHEGDLYRTRLTHSLEVAQIARTIAGALTLNEVLSEAICLAHDLGHTPFGHAGQDALNECMLDFGGFEHNLQSLRVVDELEEHYADFNGLADLATALREGYVYQGQYSAFRRRRHGQTPHGILPSQLVVCSQNHDQIGNRASGERLSMLLDLPKLQAIAALTLLSPFVPLLFQGEEWGATTPFLYFTDHQDPELASAVAAGRRREFAAFSWQEAVPNPQERDTFLRSKLAWSELNTPRHARLFDWYRRLIRIRRERPAVAAGQPAQVAFDATAGWLTFHHAGVLAVFNFADVAQIVPKPPGQWVETLRSDAEQDLAEGYLSAGATRIFTE